MRDVEAKEEKMRMQATELIYISNQRRRRRQRIANPVGASNPGGIRAILPPIGRESPGKAPKNLRVPWVEKRTGKTLAASQRAAVAMVLRSKAAVVTGGPGVGKTTLLDAILRVLAAKGTRLEQLICVRF